MRMFDLLRIDAVKLPLSPAERDQLTGVQFQTKSLHSTLSDIHITDDGYLEQYDRSGFADEPTEEELNRHIRFMGVHGYVIFHTTVNKSEFEFAAKFTDGQLVDILRQTAGGYLLQGGTCCWAAETVIGEGDAPPNNLPKSNLEAGCGMFRDRIVDKPSAWEDDLRRTVE